MPNYEVYTGFNPDKTADFFSKRHWPATTIQRKDIKLVRVRRGSPLECGDGRFDQLEDRSTNGHGIRILGGVNAVMALLTGGDEIGLEIATRLLEKHGVAPGTHSADNGGGCGFADLWIAGMLESARFPYRLHEVNKGGLRIGHWLIERMGSLGGKHFRLNGNHMEEAVRLNPFRRQTEAAKDGLRFRIDDWFMADLGLPDELRWLKVAETVEKLKPEAAKLEIIVP